MGKGTILFGTGGVPLSAKARDSIAGMERIRELGLDAMELEFVRGVHMSPATAREVNEARKKSDVTLTVHAPYFINLNSEEKAKIVASKKRIFESAEIGALAGAKSVAFHPAYYGKLGSGETMQNVEQEISDLVEGLKKEKIEIFLAPETTGRKSQFGSLEELLELCTRIKELRLVVDFSHLHARSNGGLKTEKDFEAVLGKIENAGKKYLEQLHIHASGINYGGKGELNHLMLQDKGNTFDYRLMLQALKKFGVSGIVICESPNLEEDALLMKKHWKGL